MRALGANEVIDCKAEDFTHNAETYDLIVDMMGYHSIFDYKRSLKENRQCVMVDFNALFEANKMKIVIDKSYPLIELQQAIKCFGEQ